MKIAILGAGMVGRTIAIELDKNADFIVHSFDISKANLELLAHKSRGSVPVAQLDIKTSISNKSFASIIKKFDIVVNATPGFMGYSVLEAVIEAGVDVVDISFFPEDALELHELAKMNGVTAIVDCGVAPGLSNLVFGHADSTMQDITSFKCMVGGLPKIRKKPYEYKAPFSPIDVIEEYTRPARIKEKGEIVTKPALSEIEQVDFERVGTLEAFNTDGLRSLLQTMNHVPSMIEKTLRYPGHAKLMQDFTDYGLFSHEKFKMDHEEISPRDIFSKMLIEKWKLEEYEEELTVMRIEIKNEQQYITFDLYDEYDTFTNTSSMSRTTGFMCAAAVHLIAAKEGPISFNQKGVFPPEKLGSLPDIFHFFINFLKDRNVLCSLK